MGCPCKGKKREQAVASAVKTPAPATPGKPAVWNGEPEKPSDG